MGTESPMSHATSRPLMGERTRHLNANGKGTSLLVPPGRRECARALAPEVRFFRSLLVNQSGGLRGSRGRCPFVSRWLCCRRVRPDSDLHGGILWKPHFASSRDEVRVNRRRGSVCSHGRAEGAGAYEHAHYHSDRLESVGTICSASTGMFGRPRAIAKLRSASQPNRQCRR